MSHDGDHLDFYAIGNAELERCERATAGDLIVCAECGSPYAIAATGSLLTYHCPTTGASYLAGVDGRLTTVERAP